MHAILAALVWRIRIFSQHLRKFGLFAGFGVFLRLYGLPLSFQRRINYTACVNYGGKPLRIRMDTSDISVFEGVLMDEEYDLSFLSLSPGTILDVGANVGFTSIFFANRYPQSRIFAVEPEESNFRALLGNVKPYQNIVPIRAAVWNKRGKVQIRNRQAEKWAFQVSEWEKGASSSMVDALTIDDLIKITGANTVDVLKIDVEGAEVEVCGENAEDWPGKVCVIVIELHDRFREGCSDAFERAVKGRGFRRFRRGEHIILFKKGKLGCYSRSKL
jgi:FkbM family methyltransferase